MSTKKEKLLSVIVPAYNVENYLKRCVDSLLSSTYKNLEIILIDDGSTDSSGSICDDYASRDSRIHVIHKANSGLSLTRNVGVAASTGEYIAFLDSDDWIKPEMYERLISLIEKYNLDIAGCATKRIGERGKPQDFLFKPSQIGHVLEGSELQECYRGGMMCTTVWNKVYKRAIVDGVLSPNVRAFEDNYVSPRYILRAKRAMMTNDVLHFYWRNDYGLTYHGPRKYPFDVYKNHVQLSKDLEAEGNVPEHILQHVKSYVARDIYHIMKSPYAFVHIRAIKKELFWFIIHHLDVRRKIAFLFVMLRKGVSLY